MRKNLSNRIAVVLTSIQLLYVIVKIYLGLKEYNYSTLDHIVQTTAGLFILFLCTYSYIHGKKKNDFTDTYMLTAFLVLTLLNIV